MQKAERKLWNASSGWLLLCAAALVSAGCSDRSSPAATPNINTATATAPVSAQTRAVSSPEPAPERALATVAAEAKPQPVRDITFDTVKFDIKKEEPFQRSMLTPTIVKLNNTPVRIRGFILPSFQQSGLTQFVLVRDNMECCFGPGAAIYDCIVVQMTPGNSAEFSTRPVTVEGVFSINELRTEDRWLAVYRIDGDKVR